MINHKQYRLLPGYSIKNKLIMLGLSISAFALLVIGIGMTITEVNIIKKSMLKELTVQAKIIGDNSTASLLFDDPKSAVDTLSALKANTTIDYCVLYTQEGKPFATYYRHIHGNKHPLIPYSKINPNRFGLDHVSVYHEIILDGKGVGGVYIQSNLDEMYCNLFYYGIFLLVALFLALLGSYAVLNRLQKAITAPIIRMVELMQTVSEKKNYAVRTPVESHDELGQLAAGFNEMLSQIQARDTELAQHREELEQEVAQRTLKLTEAQRIAHLGNWEWDIMNNKIEWSDEIYRIFGLTQQQFGATYEAFYNAVHPEDRQAVDRDVHATLEQAGHRPHSIDHRILLPNGTIRHVHEQGELFCDKEGQPIKMVGTVQDITEAKLAEEKLKDAKEQLSLLLNSLPIAVYRCRAEGDFAVMYMSDNVVSFTGYTPENFMEETDLWFSHIHPDDVPKVDAEMTILFEKGIHTYEYRWLSADGTYVWIQDSIKLIRPVDGIPMYMVGMWQDITKNKLSEEKIRQLNEKLDKKVKERTQQLLEAQEELVRKEKLSVLGQVAGSVGHELRNPLGVMSNAVYFLQTVLPDADESVKEYLDIIKSEIAASERIVSDLLDSVRTKPPQPEAVALAVLIEQTLGKLTLPSTVTVKLKIPETLPPIWVDAQQIHQVFRNLISNAAEAMPEGGTLEISAVADEATNQIMVTVHDNGIGMTPEQMKKLFQPLFTTKARGIGLGLVVVKNLTEANGGTVKVESKLDKGTVFSVTLPSKSLTEETA